MEFALVLANTILIAAALLWCLHRSGNRKENGTTGFFAWRGTKPD